MVLAGVVDDPVGVPVAVVGLGANGAGRVMLCGGGRLRRMRFVKRDGGRGVDLGHLSGKGRSG